MLVSIDKFLNSITMYRLVLNSLFILAGVAIVLAFLGVLPHGGLSYVYLFLILTMVCYFTNEAFAKLFRVSANIESTSITALILFLIIFPVVTVADAYTAAAVGFLAIASKYFVNINNRHIFNPAAFGAFAISLMPFLANGNVVWWVGTPAMLPIVLVIGLLIVRKIRKFAMFFAFVVVALLSTIILDPSNIIGMISQNLLSWPLIFFGTIMLTEPYTMPPHRTLQVIFAFVVGLLFISRYHFGPIYSTPELALLIGNLFAYAVSMKRRLMVTLKEKKLISKETYEFSFAADAPFNFSPGQYMEWTIPGDNADKRGNRRYFTIASSPTESEVKLGVKFYTPSSTFKSQLLALPEGKVVAAGQAGGDFIMPKNASKKLVFIAGGIGVTPFRSIIKYLIDKKERRDITLIYSVKTEDEIAYKDIFEQAEREIDLKTIYLIGNFLTDEFVKKEIADWKDRAFYLSGPNAMVENYKKLLRNIGVRRADIKTDYFPGF